MKKYSQIIMLIIIISCFIPIFACKKSNDANPTSGSTNNNNTNYYFRCKINGVDWAATVPIGIDTNFFGFPAYVILNNTSVTTNQLLVSVLQFDSVTWALESAAYVDNTFESYGTNSSMSSLQLTVSNDSINNVISGTFSFPLVNDFNTNDTIKLTNGEFKVKY